MQNKHAVISKWLGNVKKLTQEALSAKNEKKKRRKAAAAEKICRKALALSREEIAFYKEEPYNPGYIDFAYCVYHLSALLVRTGQSDRAQPILAEYHALSDKVGQHLYSIACACYYGSILCEQGRYDPASQVLAEAVKRINSDGCGTEYIRCDTYAVCRALGNAAIAFTYSDTAEGYANHLFTDPAKWLLKCKEEGIDIGNENLKKATYFAASDLLGVTCHDPVSVGDASGAVQLAKTCVSVCKEDDKVDFYLPAAMRIIALAAARDCRFADCVKACKDTLDVCAMYKYGMGTSPFGSIQNIAADMNLLLGIMHYRASQFEECIRYFKAAVSALEADAKGKPLASVGYVEVETVLLSVSSAEKASFAYKYMGLAMFAMDGKYELSECVETVRLGIEMLETADKNEPYFRLSASSDEHILSQMCSRRGNQALADEFEKKSKEIGYSALSLLDETASDGERFADYQERVGVRKRLALRLGLLELYGDYTRYEMMLREPPYTQEKPYDAALANLHFMMGDNCRVLGKYESAVAYFQNVRKYAYDQEGNRYFDLNRIEISAVSEAACLAKIGQLPQARRKFHEYAEWLRKNEGGRLSKKRLLMLAYTSRDIELNPAECAGYLHTAAEAFRDGEEECLTAAELYNQEGICWYNASPETDAPDDLSVNDEEKAKQNEQLTKTFFHNEIKAFENACDRLSVCSPDHSKVIDLMPSLMSNIGECHVRSGETEKALLDYQRSIEAFEKLFTSDGFNEKRREEQTPFVFQYGLCFKNLGEIYEEQDDNEQCAKALTKAVEVMEKLDSDAARNELAACLNALGCIKYRLGDYKGNIADITRALALKKEDKGSEVIIAIMLKNRSDAYRELGDFKSMQSDLTKSINMLDHSDLPDGLRNSFYGSHWFSMGVCQEGLNKAGKAADAYRRAAGYMDSAGENAEDGVNPYIKALCHFRRANCLCRRDEQEYYGALFEYNNAIRLIEEMPVSKERNENLRQLLASRGSLYEAFREIDLAKADFRRAESLKSASDHES